MAAHSIKKGEKLFFDYGIMDKGPSQIQPKPYKVYSDIRHDFVCDAGTGIHALIKSAWNNEPQRAQRIVFAF